jgi:hypothetical protein
MKTFHNKQKLKEYMITKPEMHKILKEFLYTEEIKFRQEDARKHKPF